MNHELTGIRIYSGMTFAESFRPIFSYFAELYFYEDSNDSSFRFPFDDDSVYEKYLTLPVATQPESGFVFDSDVLIEHAKIVDEDWNAISLLNTTDFKTHRQFENQRLGLREEPNVDFIQQRIIFFHNYDGCFWQFFTNIDGVTDSILQAHRGSVDVDLRWVNIREHYWNVGDYRADYPEPVG